MKKTLKQITKLVIDPEKLKAMCITMNGTILAFDIALSKADELKVIVDEFAMKVLEHLEKEIE